MKTLLALTAAAVLLLGIPGIAEADSLFTTPVIYVTPMTLNFGAVQRGTTATNTFVVENMGVGRLVGKATVPAPFHVLSGGDYSLRANEAQIITVTYKPSGSPTDTKTCTFTGGGEAKAIVTGRLTDEQGKKAKRR